MRIIKLILAVTAMLLAAGCDENMPAENSRADTEIRPETHSSAGYSDAGELDDAREAVRKLTAGIDRMLNRKTDTEDELRRSRDLWIRVAFALALTISLFFTGGILVGTGARKHAEKQELNQEMREDNERRETSA